MTYEEVKKIREKPTILDCDNAELSRLIDEAIEKQIPKKPGHIYSLPFRKVWADCCVCECTIQVGTAFCPYCGQALDWRK